MLISKCVVDGNDRRKSLIERAECNRKPFGRLVAAEPKFCKFFLIAWSVIIAAAPIVGCDKRVNWAKINLK